MAIFYKIYTAEAYGATSIVVCIYNDWGVNAYGATSIVVAHLRCDHDRQRRLCSRRDGLRRYHW